MRDVENYSNLPFNPKLRERAKVLRKSGNLSEIIMWKKLRNKQFMGYDFDRQKIIGNYIVDFYCLDCSVVIEIDGSSHDNKDIYDGERNSFLQSLGLTIIHIKAQDVHDNLFKVMKMLKQHPALQTKTKQ
ncbi:MAG: DUF559 domain-containing protein [Oscillospiraceae bacterium]|nr:DUF559 domain-containing protein [Oscillospiraceae bacterium]